MSNIPEQKKTLFWSWGGISRKPYFIIGFLAFVIQIIFYLLFTVFNQGMLSNTTPNPYAGYASFMACLNFIVVCFIIFLSTKRLVDAKYSKLWALIPLFLSFFLLIFPPFSLFVIIVFGMLPSRH